MDIEYNDHDFKLNEVERWFNEMEEQLNHITITRWDSHLEPLNDEPKISFRPFVEEPPMLELKSLSDTLKYAYIGANEIVW